MSLLICRRMLQRIERAAVEARDAAQATRTQLERLEPAAVGFFTDQAREIQELKAEIQDVKGLLLALLKRDDEAVSVDITAGVPSEQPL